MEYKNYYGVRLSCLVMDKNEIFAEKIRALAERARPRDPYDLVILKKKLGLKIKSGLGLLARKELNKPLDRKRIAENLKISQDRFEDEIREFYYREAVSREEIQEFSEELLGMIKIV